MLAQTTKQTYQKAASIGLDQRDHQLSQGERNKLKRSRGTFPHKASTSVQPPQERKTQHKLTSAVISKV